MCFLSISCVLKECGVCQINYTQQQTITAKAQQQQQQNSSTTTMTTAAAVTAAVTEKNNSSNDSGPNSGITNNTSAQHFAQQHKSTAKCGRLSSSFSICWFLFFLGGGQCLCQSSSVVKYIEINSWGLRGRCGRRAGLTDKTVTGLINVAVNDSWLKLLPKASFFTLQPVFPTMWRFHYTSNSCKNPEIRLRHRS